MLPVKGENSNFTFNPPRGQEDEVGVLPCRVESKDGIRNTYSVWKPSQDEIDYIVAGGLIELGIHGAWPIPPVSLNVTDERDVADVEAERKSQLSSEEADAVNSGQQK